MCCSFQVSKICRDLGNRVFVNTKWHMKNLTVTASLEVHMT